MPKLPQRWQVHKLSVGRCSEGRHLVCDRPTDAAVTHGVFEKVLATSCLLHSHGRRLLRNTTTPRARAPSSMSTRLTIDIMSMSPPPVSGNVSGYNTSKSDSGVVVVVDGKMA